MGEIGIGNEYKLLASAIATLRSTITQDHHEHAKIDRYTKYGTDCPTDSRCGASDERA